MITREEAKQNLCMNLLCSEASGISWVADDFVIELIDRLFDQQYQLEQHIKSLEAQLANTEQLSCETCSEFLIFDAVKKEMYYEDGLCLHGMSCAQHVFKNYRCNLHTPKDTK